MQVGILEQKKKRGIYIYIVPTDMIQSINLKKKKFKNKKKNTISPSNCIVVCFDSLLIVDE